MVTTFGRTAFFGKCHKYLHVIYESTETAKIVGTYAEWIYKKFQASLVDCALAVLHMSLGSSSNIGQGSEGWECYHLSIFSVPTHSSLGVSNHEIQGTNIEQIFMPIDPKSLIDHNCVVDDEEYEGLKREGVVC